MAQLHWRRKEGRPPPSPNSNGVAALPHLTCHQHLPLGGSSAPHPAPQRHLLSPLGQDPPHDPTTSLGLCVPGKWGCLPCSEARHDPGGCRVCVCRQKVLYSPWPGRPASFSRGFLCPEAASKQGHALPSPAEGSPPEDISQGPSLSESARSLRVRPGARRLNQPGSGGVRSIPVALLALRW